MAVTVLVALAALPAGASAAVGDLDPTFSGDGKLVRDLPGEGIALDVATDSQNRVLVAVRLNNPGLDFAVFRFLANGEVDSSYGGGDGFFTIDLGGETDIPHAIVIDREGRALVGGQSNLAGDSRAAIIRLTEAGGLDPSFGGGDGIFLQDLDPADEDSIHDLVVDPAGRIVATGDYGPAASLDALTLRLTPQGNLDSGFSAPDGFDALNINSVASNDNSRGVAVDSAGRIVLGGTTFLATGQEDFMAARYLGTGDLDSSFSSNLATIPGRSIVDVSAGAAPNEADFGGALQIAAGDRPMIGGSAELAGDEADFALLRLTAGGVRDASFSGDGAAYADFGGYETARALEIDRAGSPVLGGFQDGGFVGFEAARFTGSGALDQSFSGDGKQAIDVVPGAFDQGESVAIDRGGRVVIAGSSIAGTGDPALLRLEGVPRCAGKVPTLTGTPGKDKLKGTKRKDVISGGAGKDTISGLGKADTICGEAGRDRLLGGKGNDRLLGGKGNDTLIGGPGGKDRLKGGKGKDVQRQ